MICRSDNYGRHLVKSFARQANPSRVLDLGAGYGDDLDNIRRVLTNVETFGVDVSPQQQAELQKRGHSVVAINIESQPLPFDDDSVSLVVANQVFEHIKEVFWVCHEITRVIPIGGYLIVGVPNLASLHNRLLLVAGRQPTCQKNWSAHVRGFTRQDLWELFDRPFPGGWQLEDWGGSNFYPFPKWLARPLASLVPSMAWSVFVLLRKQHQYHEEYLEWPRTERLETNFWLGPESKT